MVIFFIRNFNDVDHIVPIVYRMAKDGNQSVLVLCQNLSFDIFNDFRLKFLKVNFNNVNIDYVYNKFEGKRHFDEDQAKKLLKRFKATVLVFDYVIDSNLFDTGALIKAARQLDIPTIGVPPGLPVFSENYIPEIDYFRREVNTALDYNIVPHQIDADYRIKHGFDPERIQILGSARFCEEWRGIINSMVPPDKLPVNKSEAMLKVVYMERGADLHGKYKEAIEETIAKLSRLDFVHLIIKPHTRAMQLHLSNIHESTEIAHETNSINLIKWAEVVIGTNSSILIEVLMQGKILVYPKYFHDDRMIFHDMNVCWSVYNSKELENILKKIQTGEFVKAYTDKNVDRLVEKIVYGGIKDRDVLAEYVKFIQDIENKKACHEV